MKLIKILTAFVALASLQIAAAQWLNVPPPAEARNLMVVGGGVSTKVEYGSAVLGTSRSLLGDRAVLSSNRQMSSGSDMISQRPLWLLNSA